MKRFTILKAKTNLSKLIELAENGEDVIIARGDNDVVRLVKISQPKRKFGALKGKCRVTKAFFDPLPEDELKHWSGE